MKYEIARVQQVRKALEKKIEEKKEYNKNLRDKAAHNGRTYSNDELKKFNEERKYLEVLEYVDGNSKMKVPKWIEPKVKKINWS